MIQDIRRYRIMKRPKLGSEQWAPIGDWLPGLEPASSLARELSANPFNDYAVFDESGNMIVGPDGSRLGPA